MFNSDILVDNLLDEENLDKKPSREGFGDMVVELARENEDIVVVNADLEGSLKLGAFKKEFPERLVQVGVAEQVMAGVGTGLALYGKTPVITSFAAFSPGLNWSQIRLAAMSQANLKIVSSHYGLNVGEDGASAQALEDMALMRVLPEMTVVCPADYNQAKHALKAIIDHKGPAYMRITREKFPIFIRYESQFELGKAQVLKTGDDVTMVATGSLVYEALQTAALLEKADIQAEVINLHTIKPLDSVTIATSLQKTGKLVTVEEHQLAGGMGSAVLEAMTQYNPKLQFATLQLGVKDKFGTSGKGFEVMKEYGLSRQNFYEKINTFLND